MSLSRNPAARTRPGNLHLRRTPVTARLSTVRVEQESRIATSARRTKRGFEEIIGEGSDNAGWRNKAMSRARSRGVTVVSALSPARIISSVVWCIYASGAINFRKHTRGLEGVFSGRIFSTAKRNQGTAANIWRTAERERWGEK